MRFLSWIVMVPFTLIVVVFSAVNTRLTSLDLWPLPFTVDLPLFALILSVFVVGFIWGGVISWLSGGAARSRLRGAEARAEEAERQLRFTLKKAERLEDEAKNKTAGAHLPAVANQR